MYNKKQEFNIIKRSFSIIFNLVIFLQDIILVNKIGKIINWSWKETFLGYWILLSFYAGIVMIFIIFFIPEIKHLLKKIFFKYDNKVKKVLQIFGFIGVLLIIFFLLFNIIQYSSNFLKGKRDKKFIKKIYVNFFIFILLKIVIYIVFTKYKDNIINYIYELFKHLETKQEDFESTLETEVSTQNEKIKKLVFLKKIPSYIKKFTATYFKVESKIKSS